MSEIGNYPSNSNRSKEEPEKVELRGSVTRKEETIGKSLVKMIFKGDINTTLHYALYDVLIPRFVSTLKEVFTSSIDMIFENKVTPKNYSTSSGYTSYSSMTSKRDDYRIANRYQKRNIDEITFQEEIDAQNICRKLYSIMTRQGYVTFVDVYKAAGLPSDFADNNWGWSSFPPNEFGYEQYPDGYKLRLPPPKDIRSISSGYGS